jgi:broad specificity phosphatase PhoE
MTSLVHVVRHGRTTWNADGRFRGLADPPLDSVGLTEVRDTAHRLSGHPVAAIATSPLVRARQTAAAISRIVGVEAAIEPGLIDADMGRWQGLTREEAAARDPEEFGRYRLDPRRSVVPGGDRVAAVEERLRTTIEELAVVHEGLEFIVVSHELPIRLVVSAALGLDGPAVWDLDLPTASLTSLTVGPGRWEMAP